MYFQGLEKAVHVQVSWKVCILLPNLVRLAHNVTRKVGEGSPSLTSKTVHIGTIKDKIVRPIFTMRLGLQETCNWISVPALLVPSLFCLGCSREGEKVTGHAAHGPCDLCPSDRLLEQYSHMQTSTWWQKKNRGDTKIRNALCCCSTYTSFALEVSSTIHSELVQECTMGNIFVCLQPSVN